MALLEREGQLLHATERLQDAIRRRRRSGLPPTAASLAAASDNEKENVARNRVLAAQSRACDSNDDTSCTNAPMRVSDWERRGILRMSELSLSAQSDAAAPDAAIGELTRRALDWMQRGTEQQARETRALQQLLLGAVGTLNGVFARLQHGEYSGAGNAARGSVINEAQDWCELSLENVERLADEWEDALLKWASRAREVEREERERFVLCREDCDAELQRMRQAHAAERVRCEDYAGALIRATTRSSPPHCCVSDATHSYRTRSSQQQQPQEQEPAWERENMNLKAQLKAAELCYLHWRAAHDDELERSQQTTERLAMLLEDSSSAVQERVELRRRLAKTIPVDALSVYQQKIARLEDHVLDMKQQIACDHEQFLYEHKKWELEKKHLGRDVEEIQDVSVKVLKVVLIREKLLKKQERRLQRQVAAFEAQRGHAASHCGALQAVTCALMQECALFLVALQEQTTTSDARTPFDVAPVKPIQIKRLLRRLRRLERELEAERSGLVARVELLADDCSTGDETTALWEASSSE
ncbi:hypothetical protein PybrP1_011305 [[Pythium] brassicae (nom. inval.)]|nr:hypothetical protein PybrP1_011305 [[Pythium] brassicae (nom. inval.)]